jgi:hypothetical protein
MNALRNGNRVKNVPIVGTRRFNRDGTISLCTPPPPAPLLLPNVVVDVDGVIMVSNISFSI